MPDIYAPGMGLSAQIDELFVTLQSKLQNEIRFQQQLFELLVCAASLVDSADCSQGSLDVLLASNTGSQ